MLNLLDLKPGQHVLLKNGTIGEVTENLGDGIWVQLRIGDGDEELVHCEELLDLAPAPQQG